MRCKSIMFILLPILLCGVLSLEWTGGYIKPSGVNTFYYPGNMTMYPKISVTSNGIVIGKYSLKVGPLGYDNNVTVYIDNLIYNKTFRVSVEKDGKIYFYMCGLNDGIHSVYVDGKLIDKFMGRCVRFDKYLTDGSEHKIIITNKFKEVNKSPISIVVNFFKYIFSCIVSAIKGIVSMISNI